MGYILWEWSLVFAMDMGPPWSTIGKGSTMGYGVHHGYGVYYRYGVHHEYGVRYGYWAHHGCIVKVPIKYRSHGSIGKVHNKKKKNKKEEKNVVL